MILLTHILLAVVSIFYALYTTILPSKNKLHITYFLTIGTIVSGIIMTVLNPQLLGRTCIAGVVYLGLIIITSKVARRRLAF